MAFFNRGDCFFFVITKVVVDLLGKCGVCVIMVSVFLVSCNVIIVVLSIVVDVVVSFLIWCGVSDVFGRECVLCAQTFCRFIKHRMF